MSIDECKKTALYENHVKHGGGGTGWHTLNRLRYVAFDFLHAHQVGLTHTRRRYPRMIQFADVIRGSDVGRLSEWHEVWCRTRRRCMCYSKRDRPRDRTLLNNMHNYSLEFPKFGELQLIKRILTRYLYNDPQVRILAGDYCKPVTNLFQNSYAYVKNIRFK